MYKFLLLVCVSVSCFSFEIDENLLEKKVYKIDCQNGVIIFKDEMCDKDLETIAFSSNSTHKRVSLYTTMNLRTIELLSKSKDEVVKQRLKKNPVVPNYIKSTL